MSALPGNEEIPAFAWLLSFMGAVESVLAAGDR
jgi:hypothetical protein